MHARDAFHCLALSSLSLPLFILMTEWICGWKPFWILAGDTFQKAYLEEWQRVDDGQKRDSVKDSTQTVPCAFDSSKLWKTENGD